MWVDKPLTRAEQVSMKKLEVENRKLTATILSITAQLRNLNDNIRTQLNEIEGHRRRSCMVCTYVVHRCRVRCDIGDYDPLISYRIGRRNGSFWVKLPCD